uniref:Ovule protein n=1 Tax=Gongylonema pulchrum TaxID=637853 RepID=A0A183EZL1_9BILA
LYVCCDVTKLSLQQCRTMEKRIKPSVLVQKANRIKNGDDAGASKDNSKYDAGSLLLIRT